ncbi:MAG: bifunctional DNA-formamidopyrimidine glycosylase/DNA-(apurinic or apyrimidinic site) lyase [Anaerolineae bacterium]|nr:bifunctional DNA-formamidopyrimidine glycosylase/DNA-(apurinic or apyrimidinic site) lyase [Anaerolineae bacterium]MDH7474036.1 bifunctional DNA-formamidopyrimidine glycosylase/DNA-(apurinic or apyrimidinic site) lyase [Anaerolineae bacterium]
MPELPEVETIARKLRKPLVGRTITAVEICWPRTIAAPSPTEFERQIVGQTVQAVGRRGKFLVLQLSEGATLLVHLRMAGQLLLKSSVSPPGKHVRVVFTLDDGSTLRFRDQRKFGRMWLVDDPQVVLGKLGPEPLADDFTPQVLARLIGRRSGMLKPLLLNQSFLAGLGNIYADEVLFRAGLHPRRKADSLNETEVTQLYHAIRQVLEEAITGQGTTFDGVYQQVNGSSGAFQDSLQVYRRAGKPCPRCGTPIERTTVGGRGTHFCPHCQPVP